MATPMTVKATRPTARKRMLTRFLENSTPGSDPGSRVEQWRKYNEENYVRLRVTRGMPWHEPEQRPSNHEHDWIGYLKLPCEQPESRHEEQQQ
jgi:hypothetical protein